MEATTGKLQWALNWHEIALTLKMRESGVLRQTPVLRRCDGDVVLGSISGEGSMDSYQGIQSQEDMDQLLASIAGFHDSMTKEIHLVNRGYVRPDKKMVMAHRFDAQILIHSQWEPFALEMLFSGIEELRLGDPGEYWGASGSVEVTTAPVETRRIKMAFDAELKIVSESLFYRVRKDWLGAKSFLKSEVPATDAVSAHILQDGWRQCSSCHDAWEEETNEEFSYCANCGQLTQLHNY